MDRSLNSLHEEFFVDHPAYLAAAILNLTIFSGCEKIMFTKMMTECQKVLILAMLLRYAPRFLFITSYPTWAHGLIVT